MFQRKNFSSLNWSKKPFFFGVKWGFFFKAFTIQIPWNDSPEQKPAILSAPKTRRNMKEPGRIVSQHPSGCQGNKLRYCILIFTNSNHLLWVIFLSWVNFHIFRFSELQATSLYIGFSVYRAVRDLNETVGRGFLWFW